MIFILNFILSFTIVQISALNKCTPAIENPDPSFASCENSYGCLWDLSQCSPCLNKECKCQSYGTCDTCVDGKFYNPDTETCDNCPDNCQKCCIRRSLTQYICYKCNNGYTLIGGVCKNTIGCQKQLQNSDKCIECIDGYYLDEFLSCKKCNVACTKCRTELDCIECNTVYYKKDQNGFCLKCCPQTGAKCSDNNCVVPDPITPKPECENTVAKNCEEPYYDFYESKCKCKKCKIGYYQVRMAGEDPLEFCVKCSNDKLRCRIDSENNSIAVECSGELILDLKTNECVKNTKNCRRMFGDSCSDCYDDYYPEIIDQITRQSECFLNIDLIGCKTPKQKGKMCQDCNDGFYLDDKTQTCICCNINCSKDSCKICNKCDQKGCKECKHGYRTTKDAKCSKCSNIHCRSCESLEKVCTRCIEGYGLNPQAKGDEDQCIKCQDNCKECDVDFRKCTDCHADYYILDYVCKREPDNCIVHQHGYCIQCKYGFIAEGGYCIQCANDELRIYTCPTNCTDIEISLVQLLYQSILKPQFIFFILIIIFLNVF